MGSCGLVAILAWQSVSSARLQDQSSRKVGVMTATDGAWYSTTALLSGRDRSQCLCVLRLRGSEPETRGTGRVATSLPSISLPMARAGNVELDRYSQVMMPGRKYAKAWPQTHPSTFPTQRWCWQRYVRWITSLVGGSSCWVRLGCKSAVVRTPDTEISFILMHYAHSIETKSTGSKFITRDISSL